MACEYCGMYPYHLPQCPAYDGKGPGHDDPIGQCEDCGTFIYPDDNYQEINGKFLYCEDCSQDDILEANDEDDCSDDKIEIIRDLAEDAIIRDFDSYDGDEEDCSQYENNSDYYYADHEWHKISDDYDSLRDYEFDKALDALAKEDK